MTDPHAEEIKPVAVAKRYTGMRAYLIRVTATRLGLKPVHFVDRAIANEMKRLGVKGWEISD